LTETPGVPTGYDNGSTNVGTPNFGTGTTGTAPGTANSAGSVITGIDFQPPSSPQTDLPMDGVNYNFGELPKAGISGRVYADSGTNGVDDGPATDPGIGGVAITLCLANESPCSPANTVSSTTTAPDGTYLFPDVPAGDYFVVETQPASYGSTTT